MNNQYTKTNFELLDTYELLSLNNNSNENSNNDSKEPKNENSKETENGNLNEMENDDSTDLNSESQNEVNLTEYDMLFECFNIYKFAFTFCLTKCHDLYHDLTQNIKNKKITQFARCSQMMN